MKKIIIMLAVLAVAVPAMAQQYNTRTVFDLGTNSIAAGATNAPVDAKVAITRNAQVAVGTKIKMDAADTSGLVFTFAKSVNGTDWETVPSLLVTNAATGTNAAHYVQNVDLGAVGWLRLVSVVNPGTNSVTELKVTISTKPGH